MVQFSRVSSIVFLLLSWCHNLKDEIALKSRALYPYTMNPYMVYIIWNLNPFRALSVLNR